MEVLDRQKDFRDVEQGDVLRKAAIFSEPREDLSARDELEYHVDAFPILEMALELDEEGVLQVDEDVLLRFYVIHLFQSDDVVLLHDLQGVDGPARVVL